MRCLPSPIFFLKIIWARSEFDWPITQEKKKNYRGSPQNTSSPNLNYRVPPLWPTYMGEMTTSFAMGIKVRCYGEHAEEHIRNLKNILGTKLLKTD
jgi:hypothetical protein